jgi:L-gulono-1,4-lactone dehydrogenase
MWENWSRTHRCLPAAFERPASRAEVSAAVARAAAAGRTVRAAGAGHSFTDIAVTDGTMLSLDRLDRVLDADPASGLVRVEAGMTLHRLSRELLRRGLALANLGDIDVQSLAGAIATGTHGTGARLPNLSAQVEAIELVLGDGSERTLTAADGDLLRAARLGLGSLGVVVAVTLRCVPAFRLRGVDRPERLADVLATLDERAAGADHFEFWTFPHSPLALTRTNTRTDAPRAVRGRAREWSEDVLLDNRVFALFNRAGRRYPRAIPALNRLAARAASRRERVDWSFRVFASPRLFRFHEMEYAVPREHTAEAVLGAREILERYPVTLPVELRLVAADDALLSPAHGRDCAYVAVHTFEGVPWEMPFREVEALMSRLGGRPHWGKHSFLEADELARRYPAWDAFQAARAELDPDGRFENSWARRVLTGNTGPRRDTSAPSRPLGRRG